MMLNNILKNFKVSLVLLIGFKLKLNMRELRFYFNNRRKLKLNFNMGGGNLWSGGLPDYKLYMRGSIKNGRRDFVKKDYLFIRTRLEILDKII